MLALVWKRRARPRLSVVVPLHNQAPYVARSLDSVLAQPGIDLDGDPPVHPVGGLVDRGEDVTGLLDVPRGQFEDRAVHVGTLGRQLGQLLGVRSTVLQRAGEDRRIGGHPGDVPGVDQLLQVAGDDALPGEVVEPDGDAGVGELLGGCGHGPQSSCSRKSSVGRGARISGRPR